jgi:hypothetical protein
MAEMMAFPQSPALPGSIQPLGLFVIALVAVFILWKVPQWQVRQVQGLEPKERFDRINEARKTLATILGGVVLLAGFFATWQNIRVAQEALTVSQQGQITDRFTKAIEQLGAVYPDGKPKLDVRLGGIYSLEAIANESENFHWPIVEVLCTYVREHAPVKRKESAQAKSVPANQEHLAADIQAILTVLGRRNPDYERTGQVLNLAATNLGGADLGGANLSVVDLSGTDLSGANLSVANLPYADLGGADLSGARLVGTVLSVAKLRGAILRGAFPSGADLSGADLREADLSEADLSESKLGGADLSGANLSEARYLTQQQIDTAKGNTDTKLPANLHMPESWKK